nr:MAG TPA: hypothetical protein [Caudoviricetes sp.]
MDKSVKKRYFLQLFLFFKWVKNSIKRPFI